MDTAMGVNMAQTATLGITLDRTMLAMSHTVIWDLMDGPMRERALRAIRRSRPMATQGAVKRPEPKIRMMLSEAY